MHNKVYYYLSITFIVQTAFKSIRISKKYNCVKRFIFLCLKELFTVLFFIEMFSQLMFASTCSSLYLMQIISKKRPSYSVIYFQLNETQ